MTSAVYRNNNLSLAVPATQNTAPILEFNCMYTHDVKKKNKKWQDGFLRYHTFNKRVMVYDVPRNFIGDMHWTRQEAVQEGDELSLQRVMVMVEVGDAIGEAEADLSELRKIRKKLTTSGEDGILARQASTLGARPTPSVRRPNALTASIAPLKHSSLNSLLGTPKGAFGKATMPVKSPFEERQEVIDLENEEWEDGRPPKRARTENNSSWSITRTTRTLKSTKKPETGLWAQTADAVKQRKKAALQPGQQRLGTKTVIDLSGDKQEDEAPSSRSLPGLSSEALAPSSPAEGKLQESAEPQPNPVERLSSSSLQDEEPRDRRELPKISVEQRKPKTPPAPETPNFDKGYVVERCPTPEISCLSTEQSQSGKTQAPPPSPPPPAPSGNTQYLRLGIGGRKKKTLLCQEQLDPKPKKALPASTTGIDKDPPKFHQDDSDRQARSARERLQARLEKIDRKRGSTSSSKLSSATKKPMRITIDDEDENDGVDDNDQDVDSLALGETSHETSAVELRRLDETMLPPAPRPSTLTAMPPDPRFLSLVPKPLSPPKPQQHERHFQPSTLQSPKARSAEKSKSVSGAPVRYTPLPPNNPVPEPTHSSKEIPSALADKPTAAPPGPKRTERPLQKSVSLNVTANGTSAVLLSKFQAPRKAKRVPEESIEDVPKVPEDLGPWSSEAFDLFAWRPPGKENARV